MKTYKNTLFASILGIMSLLLWTGCEEEITLPVGSIEPNFVFEGWITTRPGPYFVKITKTTDYFSEEGENFVTGAQVTIRDVEAGITDTLVESSPGMYYTTTLSGQKFHTYEMVANVEGETFEASAYINRINPIDSLYQVTFIDVPFFDDGIYPVIAASEPAGLGDYYRLLFYKNDSLYNGAGDIQIFTDKFNDGQTNSLPVRTKLEVGDSIRAEFVSIGEVAYSYYSQLQSELFSAGSPFGSPPANLKGNISNNALGLFGAGAVEGKELIIK